MLHPRRTALIRLCLAALIAASTALVFARSADIPARLSGQEFWKLTEDLSEPDGSFRSENLLSNEMALASLIPQVIAKSKPGGVYLGVGPEQNFSYMAVMKPKIAFITDIRRGNLWVLLVYKSVFELSADRVEFIARLFTKPRPAGITAASSIQQIMDAFWETPSAPEAAYLANLEAIQRHLTKTHGLPLSAADLDGIARSYRAFYWYGPAMNYSATTSLTATGGGRAATYRDLMTQTSASGEFLSYLGSEEKFRFIKDMYARNVIVPLVGNFSGPKTIRAIGAWVKERGAKITAFYVSTVEPYLKRDGSFPTFCASVATLPMDENSFFIRPGNPVNLSASAPNANLTNFGGIGSYQIGVVVPLATGCQ